MILKSLTWRRPLILVALLVMTTTLAAQGPSPAPTLKSELQRLDQLLATAREALATIDHREARGLFLQAQALRKDIDTQISLRRFREALLLTREATMLVERALKMVLETPLLRLRAQLEELLRRAENEVLGSGHREAERLVQEARRNQQMGEQSLRGQNLRTLEYFQIAIAQLERALKLVAGRGSAGMRPEETVLRARQYLLDLETQARENLPACNNPAAQRLETQARKQTQAAEEALRKGDFGMAQQLYNGAVRLMLRALDLCKPRAPEAERLQAELPALRDMIADAEEQVGAGGDPRARTLLEWARRLAQDAEAAMADGQFFRARRRLERARGLVERARRSEAATPVDFQQQCTGALLQLSGDLAELEREAQETDNRDAQSLVAMARKSHGEAERLCLRTPHSLRALAAFRMMVRLSHQFLLQAESLLQEVPASGVERQAVQQRLQQLDATLEEVQPRITSEPSDLARALVDQARQLRDYAHATWQREQLNVALDTADMALDLVREALRLSNP